MSQILRLTLDAAMIRHTFHYFSLLHAIRYCVITPDAMPRHALPYMAPYAIDIALRRFSLRRFDMLISPLIFRCCRHGPPPVYHTLIA